MTTYMHALSVKNLTKVYKNGLQALKGISLDVDEGDFFALLGPNGAGKTTLIGIIDSLVKKTSGKVLIFEKDIDTEFEIAKTYLGIVPQEFNFNIFDRVEQTIVNQAGYYGIGKKLALERMELYLKKLDLWDKRKLSPRTLSGGMKRRLMIARALINEPKLLILDEPTAGVDVELRRSMWEFLRETNRKGTTIILTTHYLEEAEMLCNKLAIINHGEIIEKTDMSDLLTRLHTETFILHLKSPLTAAPSLSFKNNLVNNKTLEIEVPNSRTMNELFSELSTNQLEIVSMQNKVSRLEELFMSLTTEKP